MRAFNAFQLVCLFVAMPYIVAYLHTATFFAAPALFWVSVVVYGLMFLGAVFTVESQLGGC